MTFRNFYRHAVNIVQHLTKLSLTIYSEVTYVYVYWYLYGEVTFAVFKALWFSFIVNLNVEKSTVGNWIKGKVIKILRKIRFRYKALFFLASVPTGCDRFRTRKVQLWEVIFHYNIFISIAKSRTDIVFRVHVRSTYHIWLPSESNWWLFCYEVTVRMKEIY